MVIVLILITLLVFFVMRLVPGDPLIMYIARSGNLENMSFDQIESLRHEYGLDKPLVTQYLTWLGNVLQGNLGYSISNGEPVIAQIGERLPRTLCPPLPHAGSARL